MLDFMIHQHRVGSWRAYDDFHVKHLLYSWTLGAPVVVSGTNISQRSTVVPINRVAMANSSSNVVVDFEEMHIDAVPTSQVNSSANLNSGAVFDAEDVSMVDEVEHPLILTGERESPFTYLASLSAKSAAMKEKAPSVQGKIKVCPTHSYFPLSVACLLLLIIF